MYGAMTKRPWRTKGIQNKNKIQVATSPGDCISINQLESLTPGFIAQLKGRLTKKRYGATTIFVNHASRLSYFQQQISSDETVEAKRAFEAYARSHGVTIKHYHAYNGCFADNAFMQSVAKSGQTISFCGAKAHFQNGIAAKRIRDLSEQARKSNSYMQRQDGQRQLRLIFGLMSYTIQTIFATQLQTRRTEAHLWNDFAELTSAQNSDTITPSVCTTRSATGRKGNTKMEQASPTQNQPWSIAMTCKLSQPSVETGHRVSLTAISHPVQ
jgi:hypothetical protein